jgi:hypothetical protein
MLGFLVGDAEPFLRSAKHFIHSLKNINIQRYIILVSFVVVNLLTKLSTDESLPVIRRLIKLMEHFQGVLV